ncbi:MarR family winged helix-turn-helix transcriptional regulator [Patulibacter americanus]|uniref:MarR family winged helix-turn-helix transcriptional regulator n=1 Tax=Patulibacter americanus TaxID=588672 RepID=UPI0003B629B1|nr:MarR family transcriptional regulator [Patulibacter americanus]
MTHDPHDIDQLALALYGLSAIRRDLQRCAGIDHAVGALMALGSVRRLGPARISDIAADLQVDLSVASRQIQALGADGYVDRVSDPHDGRSSLVALSPAGHAKLARAHERLSEALARAVDAWQPAQVTDLADGIVRLRASLARPDDDAARAGDRLESGPPGGAREADRPASSTHLPAAVAADPTAQAVPVAGTGTEENR